MNNHHLVQRLFSYSARKTGADSLVSMRRIDEWQGRKHRRFKSIHVAGTNGKGSVSWKIASALRMAGCKTGLYTSPHISTYRERIQVDGEMISEEFVMQYLPELFAFIDENKIQPTFFALLTAIAFEYFADQNIETAVIEVGLGGEFDATNVIDASLCVITSISYDHMEILGHSLDEIARAKAGIIKDSVSVVVGPRARYLPILEAAKGDLILAPDAPGFYDDENNAVARAALERLGVSEPAIRAGLACRPPCRFEIIGQGPVILDAAHNLDGFDRLRSALEINYPHVQFHIILALGKNKNPALFMEQMKSSAGRIACVSNGHPRLAGAEELLDNLHKNGFSSAYRASSIAEVLGSSDPLLVCGSFFILGDARNALGLSVSALH